MQSLWWVWFIGSTTVNIYSDRGPLEPFLRKFHPENFRSSYIGRSKFPAFVPVFVPVNVPVFVPVNVPANVPVTPFSCGRGRPASQIWGVVVTAQQLLLQCLVPACAPVRHVSRQVSRHVPRKVSRQVSRQLSAPACALCRVKIASFCPSICPSKCPGVRSTSLPNLGCGRHSPAITAASAPVSCPGKCPGMCSGKWHVPE